MSFHNVLLSPLEKGMALHLKNLDFFSPKDTLKPNLVDIFFKSCLYVITTVSFPLEKGRDPSFTKKTKNSL